MNEADHSKSLITIGRVVFVVEVVVSYFSWVRTVVLSLLLIQSVSAQSASLLSDLAPGPTSSSPQELTIVGEKLFFVAFHPDTGIELWVSDGTPGGQHLVKDIIPGPVNSSFLGDVLLYPRFLTALGGQLLFIVHTAQGPTLWRSDGTNAGTVPVKFFGGYELADDTGLVKFGDAVYFSADDGVHGLELWRSDGTTAGTRMVYDINPYPGGDYSSSYPQYLYALPNRLIFFATDFAQQSGLWSTDGTAQGTKFIGSPDYFYGAQIVGSRAFLTSASPDGKGLWVTDGTVDGTQFLKEFTNDQGELRQIKIHPLENGIAFLVVGSSIEIWFSDGSVAGTVQLSSVPLVSNWYNEYPSITFDNKAVFAVRGPVLGRYTLLGTNGTESGTYNLAVLHMNWVKPFIFEGEMFLHACPQTLVNCELWRSDGTFLGTQPTNITDPAMKFLHENGVKFKDQYYATYDDGLHGSELWVLSPPDNCPEDPLKLEPGICGCGMSDSDDDGDGAISCHDSCPSDPLKLSSVGACGCGFQEIDQSGNGVFDCKDPSLSALPATPQVTVVKDKVIVTMPSFSKVIYEVTMMTTPTKGQAKVLKKKKQKMLKRFFSTTTKSVIFPKVNPGKGYVTYRMLTGSGFATPLSAKRNFKVKPKKSKK